MTDAEVLARCDHTVLRIDMTLSDALTACRDALDFGAASVCLPPCYVARARAFSEELRVCTVIGFPNGYSTAASKLFEARDALKSGADELDMVVNPCLVKDSRFDEALSEIDAVKALCGERILKVIIEACNLSAAEKERVCRLISDSSADFIKTSTGFARGGATFEDVALLRRLCPPRIQVKAAGGISSFEAARRFIELGASRLGASRLVALAKAGR